MLGDLAALHRRDRTQRQLPGQIAGDVDVADVRAEVVVGGDARTRRPSRRRSSARPRPSEFGIEPMASSTWLPSATRPSSHMTLHARRRCARCRWPGRPSAASRRAGGSRPRATAATSGSFCGSTCWRLTTSVTFEPNDRNMWTNSTPVTPEPMTTRCSGSSSGRVGVAGGQDRGRRRAREVGDAGPAARSTRGWSRPRSLPRRPTPSTWSRRRRCGHRPDRPVPMTMRTPWLSSRWRPDCFEPTDDAADAVCSSRRGRPGRVIGVKPHRAGHRRCSPNAAPVAIIAFDGTQSHR